MPPKPGDRGTFRPHTLSPEEVMDFFGVDDEEGMNDRKIARARKQHGWNELDKEPPTPLWQLVAAQFDDALVKILLAAAAVSFALAWMEEDGHGGIADFVEPLVILVILFLNAGVGVWQESNAESALEALKDLQPSNCRVIREGVEQTIESRELVPGDIVTVVTGDKVPADVRVLKLKTTTLRVEQASLTGESTSVTKDTAALPASSSDVVQAKTNMAFASTVVVNGACTAIVIHTGMNTEIGEVQRSVQEAAEEEVATPLKQKLDEFGEQLSWIILVICVAVWAINYGNFFDPVHGSVLKGCIYYFKIAVALAVAAIPEGLPAVITTCLALGTRKMAKKNAIVRKLPSVETLGCTSVICSDKTGTLTTNEMSAVKFCNMTTAAAMEMHVVRGHTYSVEGGVATLPDGTAPAGLRALAAGAAVCNDSTIEWNADEGRYVRVGMPTEAALKVLVEKMGLPGRSGDSLVAERQRSPAATAEMCCAHWTKQFPKIATLEFSRDRKSMSVICRGTGRAGAPNVLLVKGAPESLLERCDRVMLQDGSEVPLTPAGRAEITRNISVMAQSALRTMGFAQKPLAGGLATFDGSHGHPARAQLMQPENFAGIESGLCFTGLVGMLDPPRPEVRPSIELCRQAGIRVVVITGDNKETAESICRQIGVFGPSESLARKSFTGSEFFAKSEAERKQILMCDRSGRVFSRTEPRHKMELVRILRQNGEVAAMTGDGVNDAPALKMADIGVAMGITGTEVAKEAADMVLADDNFATIVSAVEEGRSIFSNMAAFIRYLISSNIGEVAAVFLTALLGVPEGLIPVQLLAVNLLTDGPPATALGFNPPDVDIMSKPPRNTSDALISKWIFIRYMIVGLYVGFACVGVFCYWYMYYDDGTHTLVTFDQLTHWGQCANWESFEAMSFSGIDLSGANACNYFTDGKTKASTLSFTVLVVIEMLNALNALSEDNSLVVMPPWINPYLILACVVSIGLHAVILYLPVFNTVFSVLPLNYDEWLLVLYFSMPVLLIEEVLKAVGRFFSSQEREARLAKALRTVD